MHFTKRLGRHLIKNAREAIEKHVSDQCTVEGVRNICIICKIAILQNR